MYGMKASSKVFGPYLLSIGGGGDGQCETQDYDTELMNKKGNLGWKDKIII